MSPPDARADGTSGIPTTVQEDRQECDEGCDEQKKNLRVLRETSVLGRRLAGKGI